MVVGWKRGGGQKEEKIRQQGIAAIVAVWHIGSRLSVIGSRTYLAAAFLLRRTCDVLLLLGELLKLLLEGS